MAGAQANICQYVGRKPPICGPGPNLGKGGQAIRNVYGRGAEGRAIGLRWAFVQTHKPWKRKLSKMPLGGKGYQRMCRITKNILYTNHRGTEEWVTRWNIVMHYFLWGIGNLGWNVLQMGTLAQVSRDYWIPRSSGNYECFGEPLETVTFHSATILVLEIFFHYFHFWFFSFLFLLLPFSFFPTKPDSMCKL